jgi:hypothetical protein
MYSEKRLYNIVTEARDEGCQACVLKCMEKF